MKQTVLNEAWQTVREARDKNKNARLNWRLLLGESIDNLVFKNCETKPPQEIIKDVLIKFPFLTDEAKRRLVINVNSSYVRAMKRRGV